MRQVIIIVSYLFLHYSCPAQIELSGGIDLGYPQVLSDNKILTSGQISDGLHAGIVYRPEDMQFFPALYFSYGRIRLPLHKTGKNVAALSFNYVNVLLDENFVVPFHQGELLIYGGIGLSCLLEKGIAPSGNETIVTTIDSTANVSKVFPAMNIGIDYSVPAGKSFYVSAGINFQYTLLLSGRNTYYVTVTEPGNNINHYQSALVGNLINPGIYVAVHYRWH